MAKSLPPDYETYRPVVEADGLRKKALVDRSLVETVLGHVEPANVEPEPSLAADGVAEPQTAEPQTVVQFPNVEGRKRASRAEVPAATPAKAPAAATGDAYERMTEALRFKVTQSERQEIGERINRHAGALRTRLTLSHLMRVWVNILRDADPYILKALEGAALKRPGNEDALAVAEFEEQLTELYLAAVERMAKRRKAEAQGA
jgi:hypothetical protein